MKYALDNVHSLPKNKKSVKILSKFKMDEISRSMVPQFRSPGHRSRDHDFGNERWRHP